MTVIEQLSVDWSEALKKEEEARNRLLEATAFAWIAYFKKGNHREEVASGKVFPVSPMMPNYLDPDDKIRSRFEFSGLGNEQLVRLVYNGQEGEATQYFSFYVEEPSRDEFTGIPEDDELFYVTKDRSEAEVWLQAKLSSV